MIKRGTLLAVSLALLAFAPAARAGDLVVVEATGANLRPGQVIDDTQKLVLKSGEQVKLIGQDGSIRTLRGPYEEAPATTTTGGGGEISKALASLVTGQRAEFGVVRAKVEDVNLPSPWVLDVSHSGKVCVRNGEQIVFWRSPSSGGNQLTVMPIDRSWRAQAEWPSGTDRLEAPPNFPIKERRTYLFSLEGQSAAVTLIGLPDSLVNDRMRAAWMLENNCLAQTKALLKTLQ